MCQLLAQATDDAIVRNDKEWTPPDIVHDFGDVSLTTRLDCNDIEALWTLRASYLHVGYQQRAENHQLELALIENYYNLMKIAW
jgi:hypothetical protein